jgi:putative flippase GtrA
VKQEQHSIDTIFCNCDVIILITISELRSQDINKVMNQVKISPNKVLRQLKTFCVVGLLNAVINYGIFYISLELFGDYKIAGILGFLAGGINGFFLNRKFTFNSTVSYQKGAVLYFLVQIISLSGHVITQLFVVEVLRFAQVNSQFFGIITSTALNFMLLKWVVFK